MSPSLIGSLLARLLVCFGNPLAIDSLARLSIYFRFDVVLATFVTSCGFGEEGLEFLHTVLMLLSRIVELLSTGYDIERFTLNCCLSAKFVVFICEYKWLVGSSSFYSIASSTLICVFFTLFSNKLLRKLLICNYLNCLHLSCSHCFFFA